MICLEYVRNSQHGLLNIAVFLNDVLFLNWIDENSDARWKKSQPVIVAESVRLLSALIELSVIRSFFLKQVNDFIPK